MRMGTMAPLQPAATALVLVLAALALWTIIAFNRLVRERNLMREGWSGIDVQLKRRRNLIPAIVEAVKGYAGHEQRLLENVTELRGERPPGEGLAEMQDRENVLTDQLKKLFAVVEAYPDLKASKSFLELQGLLVEIEDQIQMARRYYNGTVRNYNTRAESFPSNVVAALFRFKLGEFFQIETATERAAPKVEM